MFQVQESSRPLRNLAGSMKAGKRLFPIRLEFALRFVGIRVKPTIFLGDEMVAVAHC